MMLSKAARYIFGMVLLCVLCCGCVIAEQMETDVSPIKISREIYKRLNHVDSVYWLDDGIILLEQGEDHIVFDITTGRELISNVQKWNISRTDEIIVLLTDDGDLWQKKPGEALERVPMPLTEGSKNFSLWAAHGWVAVYDSQRYFIWNTRTKQKLQGVTAQGETFISPETWTDPETEEALLLLSANDYDNHCTRFQVYRESCEMLYRNEDEYTLEENCRCQLITNGRLTGYRCMDQCPVILDLWTGKEIASFSKGWEWRIFTAGGEIFEDGTALMDYNPSTDGESQDYYCAIVDLDGKVLIQLSAVLYDRRECENYRTVPEQSDSITYEWDQNACIINRVIMEDGKRIKTESVIQEQDHPGIMITEPDIANGKAAGKYAFPIPDVVINWEDFAPGIAIYNGNRDLLGGRIWDDIWSRTNEDGLEMSHEQYFARTGFLPVKSEDGYWGILSYEGNMILPAIFDRLEFMNPDHEAANKEDFHEVSAWKNNEVMIYDREGHPLLEIEDV